MEEKKRMERSVVLDSQLNADNMDEKGKSSATGTQSLGCEIKNIPPTDKEHNSAVVSRESVSVSGVGIDKSESVYKETVDGNIIPGERTTVLLENSGDLCNENSAEPDDVPSNKLLIGSRDMTSKEDKFSDNACTSLEQRDSGEDHVKSSVCDPIIECESGIESSSEPVQVISQNKGIENNNVSNIVECNEKENSSAINLEPQSTRPENSEVLTGCKELPNDESVHRENVQDSDNFESFGIVDSISNVDVKKKLGESDSESFHVDNNELEMISCESSCDQDIKQMENINIDEKDVFSDTGNEQTIERDPLLHSPEMERDEPNVDEENKCDATEICKAENSAKESEGSVKESDLKLSNDGLSRSENEENEANNIGNNMRDSEFDNEDRGNEEISVVVETSKVHYENSAMDTESAVLDPEDATIGTDDPVIESGDAGMDSRDEVCDTDDAVMDTNDAVMLSNKMVDKEDSVLVEDEEIKYEETVVGAENTVKDKEDSVIKSGKSVTEAKVVEEGRESGEKISLESNLLHEEDGVTPKMKEVSDKLLPLNEGVPSCEGNIVDSYVVQDSEDRELDSQQTNHTNDICIVEDSVTSIKSIVDLEKSVIDDSQNCVSSDSASDVILQDKGKSSENKEDIRSENSNFKMSVGVEEVKIDEKSRSVESDSSKNVQVNETENQESNDCDTVSADEVKLLDAVSIETKETDNTDTDPQDKVDRMELIEVDSSERDEMSQNPVDNCQIDSGNDKVPADSNENLKDQEIANESNDEMDIEELAVEDDTGGNDSKSDGDNCEGIDISAMCETVIEEAGSVDDLENAPMSQDQEENGTNRILLPARGENRKQAGRLSSGVEDDEEICIIPDTYPRSVKRDITKRKMDQKAHERSVGDQSLPDFNDGHKKEEKGKMEASKARKVVKPTEIEKLCDKTALEKISMESRRTPGRPQRQAAKRAESQIKEIAAEEVEAEERNIGSCDNCYKVRTIMTSITFQENGVEKIRYFCTADCAANYKRMAKVRPGGETINNNTSVVDSGGRFTRKCAQCSSFIHGDEHTLSWETMDYCNEDCLGKYQKIFGSQCANCRGTVAGTSLGKYCVRFGYDVKQFCCSGCLEEFKKGLKLCSYCLKDISGGSEGFLAPVGDKGQFKDFCTQSCMEKYDQMSNHNTPPVIVQECAVCNNEKVVAVEVVHKELVNKFCSEPCFAAFRFVNGMIADQCFMCKKYFDKNEVDNFSVYSDELVHNFCSKTCMNVYILANRKIVPCHWCKVKKYNFDMIKKVLSSGLLLVCSLNCLSLYEAASNNSRKRKCDMCSASKPLQYQLHMLDNTSRSFCNYQCAVQFQEKYSSSVGVVPSPLPPENVSGLKSNGTSAFPVISSVQSLAGDGTALNSSSVSTRKVQSAMPNSSQTKIVRQIIVRPPLPKQMRNKAISCKPPSHTKGTHCRPMYSTKETQTENDTGKPTLIPVPVPIYVPAPMCMYSNSFPVPVPFPLPVPVPVFIPTTRNSAKGIMKEIKRIQEKIPTDPFEAELLMMAEIVAGEKKGEESSDSDSDAADNPSSGTGGAGLEEATSTGGATEEGYTPDTDANNTFGDDMLQMALKMATELDEPTDLEAALTPSTITPQTQSAPEHNNSESEDDPEPAPPVQELRSSRGRKRSIRTSIRSTSTSSSPASNKRRRVSNISDPPSLPPPEPQPQPVEKEKPDANMCLKYTLGVNAWKRWVLTKNAELEKATASNRKLKLFKTEILQQTADELNYSLCLFVKEVRKPSGQEYAPDTIYYLCLGIQQYLFENARIDNIFTDPYYEKFTECLDEVAKKFATLYNDSQYIVTRVEEEHLWESKQLGAHSPHVLLSTLMFFNTKHFNLTTVEEHMQLSFSHIMKHWKRNPNQSGSSKGPGGSRNVLLRFYPPQSALEANSRKKKVYEQQENEENPLRCPVKLYEFYLSKCPESVKTRNDVFYLLPERSCVPDSPVWYSTMALGKEPLMKMLHRVKMVKEINQALLKS